MSERTAEEWGRAAVALDGWRWMPGMRELNSGWRWDGTSFVEQGARNPQAGNCIRGVPEPIPDPDDPATAGCLMALLGPYACSLHDAEGWMAGVGSPAGAKFRVNHNGSSLGRACISAAEAIGRWPHDGRSD